MDRLAKAPDSVPAQYEAHIDLLHKQVRTLMDLKQIPYMAQSKLSEEEYRSMGDIADRWNSPDLARQEGPKELEFEPTKNHYDDKSSRLVAMKLYQVVKAAKQATSTGPPSPGGPSQMPLALTGGLEVPCDRQQLEAIYLQRTGQKPSLEDQGSDSLLRKQYRFCMRGEVGFIHTRHLVSHLPEVDERPFKRARRSITAGLVTEEEEEERQNPTTMRQLEKMHLVFRTNLMMCTGAFTQFRQFDATTSDLSSFYNWFYGPDIAGRSPPPPVAVLMLAERSAWREISRSMQLGSTLTEALAKIQMASLFWQREVYEKMQRHLPLVNERSRQWTDQYSFGKGKGKPSQFFGSKGRERGDKGKGKFQKGDYNKGRLQKGPSKGKPKGGKSDQWPSNWARKSPKGMEFCIQHHMKGQCQGNCNRSHNCPVLKDGWVCMAPPEKHHPSQCPNL